MKLLILLLFVAVGCGVQAQDTLVATIPHEHKVAPQGYAFLQEGKPKAEVKKATPLIYDIRDLRIGRSGLKPAAKQYDEYYVNQYTIEFHSCSLNPTDPKVYAAWREAADLQNIYKAMAVLRQSIKTGRIYASCNHTRQYFSCYEQDNPSKKTFITIPIKHQP